MVGGTALAFGIPALVGFIMYGGSKAVFPTLLYWPLSVTNKLGFIDCADANSVSDKVACVKIGLLIDAIVYSLAIFVCSYFLYRVFFRRGGHLRPSPVA